MPLWYSRLVTCTYSVSGLLFFIRKPFLKHICYFSRTEGGLGLLGSSTRTLIEVLQRSWRPNIQTTKATMDSRHFRHSTENIWHIRDDFVSLTLPVSVCLACSCTNVSTMRWLYTISMLLSCQNLSRFAIISNAATASWLSACEDVQKCAYKFQANAKKRRIIVKG